MATKGFTDFAALRGVTFSDTSLLTGAYQATNNDTLEGGAVADTRQAFVDRLATFLKKRAGIATIPASVDTLQRMYEGDYWQNGAMWMGPLPQDIPDELRHEISRYFASRNMIKECVDRHFDAIVGEDPRINTTPKRAIITKRQRNEVTGKEEMVREQLKPEEQQAVDQYDASLTNWYDMYDAFTPFVEGLPSLLTRGSALYRIYVPYHLLDNGGEFPTTETLDDSLALIRIMPIDHTSGRTVKTSAGDIIGAWYCYNEGNSRITEIHYVDTITKETVIAVNISGQGYKRNQEWHETRLELGGRLLIVEVSRRYPFVTPQAMQLSNLLNVDYTVLGRNLTQAGFLERILLNTQLPGSYEDILDENGDPTGERRFLAEPQYYGSGTTNVLIGVEQVDDNGEGTGKRATPGVVYRDPVPVNTFIDTDNMLRQGIYAEFKQSHMMISSSSTTTGRSREQALNDFSASIRFSARIINRGLSTIFDTVMAFAAWISDDVDYIQNYKTVVQCRLTLKLLTPDEKRIIMEQYDRELLSAETSMLEMGHVSDPEAEFGLIDAEGPRRDAFLQRQIKAGAAFKTGDGESSSNPNGNKSGENNKKNKPTGDNGVGKMTS